MALSIKTEEADRLARELSRLTGETMTDAITRAMRERLERLRAEPGLAHTAVMCAEAVPWRCHRSLIADAMLARGETVENIFVTPEGKSHRKPATMTPFAVVEGERVWYPAEDAPVRGLFDE